MGGLSGEDAVKVADGHVTEPLDHRLVVQHLGDLTASSCLNWSEILHIPQHLAVISYRIQLHFPQNLAAIQSLSNVCEV